MQTMKTIRVALIEDDVPLRNGLGLLIDTTPGYRCVGGWGSITEGLQEIGSAQPDVLLLDIFLPGTLGSDGVRQINEKFPAVLIMMLTVYAEEDKVFESICNGATGYLLKKTPPVRLLEAVREVYEGGSPMSPEIARKVVTLFQKTRPPEKSDFRLTPQETRLLRMLVEGHTYQSAADELHLSINTIRDYIRSIYHKLHVHSKSAAVSKALKNRLIY